MREQQSVEGHGWLQRREQRNPGMVGVGGGGRRTKEQEPSPGAPWQLHNLLVPILPENMSSQTEHPPRPPTSLLALKTSSQPLNLPNGMFSFEDLGAGRGFFFCSKPLIFFSSTASQCPSLKCPSKEFWSWVHTEARVEQLLYKMAVVSLLGQTKKATLALRFSCRQLEVTPAFKSLLVPGFFVSPVAPLPSPVTETLQKTPARRWTPWISAQLIRKQ